MQGYTNTHISPSKHNLRSNYWNDQNHQFILEQYFNHVFGLILCLGNSISSPSKIMHLIPPVWLKEQFGGKQACSS